MNKELRNKLIYLGVAVLVALITMFLTKNFIYFIFVALLSISIYFIMNAKEFNTKRKVALISTIVSGILSGFCLFAYLYSQWILPFAINLLHLPALDGAKELESMFTVAKIFLIIGLVFLVITIGFLIVYWLLKRKEDKNLVLENM